MEAGAKRFLLITSLIVLVVLSTLTWLEDPRWGKREWMCDAHAATYDALMHPRPEFPYVPPGMTIKPGWCAPADLSLDLVEGPLKGSTWYRVSCSGEPLFVARYSGNRDRPRVGIVSLTGFEGRKGRPDADCRSKEG